MRLPAERLHGREPACGPANFTPLHALHGRQTARPRVVFVRVCVCLHRKIGAVRLAGDNVVLK